MFTPEEVRKRHAECEKRRRVEKKEQVDKIEKKRSLTPKRKLWQQQYHQKWYAAHKEETLKYQSVYRRADPVRRDNYKRVRVARLRALPNTLTETEWQEILKAYDNKCAYCNKSHPKLEKEHKTPVLHGGGRTKENTLPVCPRCNRRKISKTDEEFRAFLKLYPNRD